MVRENQYTALVKSAILATIDAEYRTPLAWNRQVPQNGTQSLSFTNLDFKNWPLPLDCYISLGGASNGSGGAYFVLNNQDPNISPKTWGAVTTSTAAPTSSSSFTDPATTTPILTTTTPTPAASTVTIAAIATPTAPLNTATAPQGSTPNVPKGAIAGATVGGFVTVALCLVAFVVQRRHRARRVEEGQNKAYESRENVSNDAPPYWKPEMPTDNQPQLLHEMPLDQNTGYSLAPYEMHTVETQEMPATPGSRLPGTHEMPATTALRWSSA